MEITQDHLTMLHSIAWSYHRATGVDVDDLFGEACLAFVSKMHLYDPARAKMSTFLYAMVKHPLLHYISKQKNGDHHQPMPILIGGQSPDTSIMFSAKVDELGRSARKLYKLILKSPDIFLDMSLEQLTEHLRKLDWPWDEIRSAIKDMKKLLC